MIAYRPTHQKNSFEPIIISKAFFIFLYLFHQITTFQEEFACSNISRKGNSKMMTSTKAKRKRRYAMRNS